MVLPAAVTGAAIAGGKLLATYAVLSGINHGLNEFIPKELNRRMRNAQRRKDKKALKRLRSIHKAYHSKLGQHARAFTQFAAGGAVASAMKGKKTKQPQKSEDQPQQQQVE